MGSANQTLECALEELYSRRTFGIKPGLEPIEEVLDALGHPERSFAAIQVAGTNGKGSVSAMLAAMLQELGPRVGLYTSPHIVSFAERIRIDGHMASREMLCAALADVLRAEAACGRTLTFFECATAMAFIIFREQGVQFAVVETGLGGRLDATNVLNPVVCAITRIGMDHTQWLGTTLTDIAAEKAGIIKPCVPVVCGPQEEEVTQLLAHTAATRGSPLLWAAETASVRRISGDLSGQILELSTQSATYGRVHIALPGRWQLENLPIAVGAFELVCRVLGVDPDPVLVQKGLRAVRWPGRMELAAREPSVVLDAAHNPLGARELVRGLKACGIRRVAWVLGVCADKDVEGVVRELHAIPGPMRTVPVGNERGMAPEELVRVAVRRGFNAEASADVGSALGWAREQVGPSDPAGAVVVCGSIFLLEHAYAALGLDPFPEDA